MRNYIIILIFCFIFSQQLFSQQAKKKNQISISYSSFGNNELISFQNLDGAPSYNGDYYYSFGIHYLHSLNKWLFIESGIEYAKHRFTVAPNLPPNISASTYSFNLFLLEIPFTLRAEFLKYFFVNTGSFIDFDIRKNNTPESQTGTGTMFGAGAKYDFKSGFSIFAAPYVKVHSLLPFNKENNQFHLMESGFRFGISYHF
ncbi:MAG: porin family protein [Bacteroidales bacterium]|nr:porin family protein [Bacteroidales bacterium]